MSLRAQIYCPNQPACKSRSISLISVYHRKCTHQLWISRIHAQAGSGTAGDMDVAAGTATSHTDPWATSSLDPTSPSVGVIPSASKLEPVSAPPAASSSPWDASLVTSLSSSLSASSEASDSSSTLGKSSYSYDENDPAAAAAMAAAAAAAAAAATAAVEVGQTLPTPRVDSGTDGAASTSPLDSNSSNKSPASPASSSSSRGAFTMKEVSASLSEDTAALLTRLRAELARTSNIPMPPRRAQGSSSISTNTGTSATSASSGTTTNISDASISSSGNSNRKANDNDVGPSKSDPAAAAPGASLKGTPARLGVANTSAATTAATAAAAAVAPTTTITMSTEALAAALVASGAAGQDAAVAKTPSSSSPPTPPTLSPSTPSNGSITAAGVLGRLAGAGGSAVASAVSTSAVSSNKGVAATAIAATSATASGDRGSGVGAGSGRRRKAVVVGGGIGGLVSAARLAKEGFSVTLFEANSQVGGRCQSVLRGRFRFDTGPSLLLFIEIYRKAFAALGTSLAQQVPVVRVTPAAYRVFFQGAGYLDMLYDVQRMVEQLEGVEKGAGGQYLDWLASSRAALELGLDGFISKDAEGLGDLLSGALQDPEMRSLLTSVGVGELLGNHHDRMSRRFRDPQLRALFTFQDLYVGLTPYNAPGVYSLLAATELTDGVWYPLGGFGQIRDALLRVGQGLGVRLRCGARVTAIRTVAGEGGGKVVTGVTLASGEEVEADLVVSNRDVPLTYELLRGEMETHGSTRARQLLAQDYSAGVIAFNWSVNKKLDQLLHHNVFLSGDYEGSWMRATGPDTLSRSPNFYVHCPGRTDPTACPPGTDSVMVLLPVANIQEVVKAQEAERRRTGPLGSLPGPLGQQAAELAAAAGGSGNGGGSGSAAAAAAAAVSYSSLVAAGREAVLRSLAEAGISDVRQHIVDELVIDPVEWRDRYSLAHGAAFGLSHGLNQLSVFRPGLSDKQVRGLYLVGASTRPGNGVPLTMISGELVIQRVIQDVAAGVI